LAESFKVLKFSLEFDDIKNLIVRWISPGLFFMIMGDRGGNPSEQNVNFCWTEIRKRVFAILLFRMFKVSGSLSGSESPSELGGMLPEPYNRFVELIGGIREISILFGKYSSVSLRCSDNMKLISALLPSKNDIPDFIKNQSN